MKFPHDWIAPEWPAPARVRSLITTRNGGVSTGAYASFNLGMNSGDDETRVLANRRQLSQWLPQEPRWLRQVHGARTLIADGLAGSPEADSSIARESGTVCAVMIADCMPVLLCDTEGSVVGIAHAGWRGLNSGVIESTVRAMRVAGSGLMAYLGPAIGPCAFEVGDEVRAAFIAEDHAAAQAFEPLQKHKWLCDLYMLARQRLARCGVRRIFEGGLCTYSDAARFYSYRRDQTTGRMAAFIWMGA